MQPSSSSSSDNQSLDELNPSESTQERQTTDQYLQGLPGDSYQRLADVRRLLWYGGIKGALTGLILGMSSMYTVTRYYPHWISKKPMIRYVKNNYIVFGTLTGAAFGSFIGASVEGKNAFPFIAHIFIRERSQVTSSYQRALIDRNEEKVSDDTFERRLMAIEKTKEERRLAEEEIKKRSY